MYTEARNSSRLERRIPAVSPRVLVVDDEKMVTEVVERYLQREGYDVAVAGDGLDALRIARECHGNSEYSGLFLDDSR